VGVERLKILGGGSDIGWLCGVAAILLPLMYVGDAYGWLVGLGVIGALSFLVWFVLVFPHARREAMSAVGKIGGLQFIVLILFVSAYVEAFFPAIAVRDRYLVQQSPANAVNLSRIGLVGLAGLMSICFAYLRPRGLGIHLRGPIRWMFLYAAVAVISSSYASLPEVSAGKAAEVMVDVVCFLVLASLLYAEDFLRSWNMLWFILLLLLGSVWVSAFLFPSVGFEYQPGALFPLLSGVYPTIHPDRLGQLGAGLAIVALCKLLRTGSRLLSQAGMFWGGICLFGLATLAASQARTSMAALALAIPVCLHLYRRLKSMTILGLVGIAILVGACGYVLFDASDASQIISQYVSRGQSPEVLYSLSGRFDYWQPAWELFSSSPFLGRGFYTAHRIDLNAIWGRLDLSTVDNTYLEVLLGIGIIGLFPLLAAIGALIRRIVQTLKLPSADSALFDGQKEMIGVFIIALFRSITGPSFQVHGENLVFLLLIMAFVQSIYTGRLARPAAMPPNFRVPQLRPPS
jgi:O-antigen ligase